MHVLCELTREESAQLKKLFVWGALIRAQIGLSRIYTALSLFALSPFCHHHSLLLPPAPSDVDAHAAMLPPPPPPPGV